MLATGRIVVIVLGSAAVIGGVVTFVSAPTHPGERWASSDLVSAWQHRFDHEAAVVQALALALTIAGGLLVAVGVSPRRWIGGGGR